MIPSEITADRGSIACTWKPRMERDVDYRQVDATRWLLRRVAEYYVVYFFALG